MNAHILVTGGAGFIGTHLVRQLLERHEGGRVTVLDDFSAPSSLALPEHPRLRVIVGDVRSASDVAACGPASGWPAPPQQVVHLASVVGVDAVLADPERTGSVIRDGTATVLEAARGWGAPLLFFSTSEVTDGERAGPRAVYAHAKRDAEVLLSAQARGADGLPVTIVRPFNIVGPGQSAPGMVLPALARAARLGERLPVHGSGRQERSFLHVDDCVRATLALLEESAARSIDQPTADPTVDVIEIGSEERTSIAGLARRIAELSGGACDLDNTTPAEHREDLPRRAPDLTALRRRVPFRPRWGLSEIVRDALAHA